jgi:bacterioferritin-associated ferredoxin
MVRIIGRSITMIVCSCNAIREADIRKAARCGAPTGECAYRSMGFEPQCGTCLCHADEIVEEERVAMLSVSAKAA